MIRGGTREPLALLVVSYVAARLLLVINAEPFGTPDTIWYQGDVSLLGNAPRPWLLPLVHAALPERGVMLLQTLLSAGAFLVLAFALAATVRSVWLRVGLMAIVLLIGVSPRVTNWDMAMLSESIAISMTCLLIACLAHLPTMIDRYPAALVAVVTLWAFSRDANMLIVLPVGLLIAAFAWRRGRQLVTVALGVSLLWVGVVLVNDRTVEGLNVITHLVDGVGESDPEAIDWFIANGMPDHPAFDVEDNAERRETLFYDLEFREWAETEGVGLYVRYALENPEHLLVAPLRGATFDDPGWKRPHDGQGLTTVWPGAAGGYTLLLVGAAFGAAGAAWRRGRRPDPRTWIAAGLVVSTLPHLYLIHHGSAIEHDRHSLTMQFVVVLGSWWLLAMSFDELNRSAPGLEARGVATRAGVRSGHGSTLP